MSKMMEIKSCAECGNIDGIICFHPEIVPRPIEDDGKPGRWCPLPDSKEQGWQDIATAPNDGTHIMLFRPEIQFIGYYGGSNSGWRINAQGQPSLWPLPTHWMPLPAPPEDKP